MINFDSSGVDYIPKERNAKIDRQQKYYDNMQIFIECKLMSGYFSFGFIDFLIIKIEN